MNNKKLSDVKKIAVVRANALGDFIFVIPALRALKEAYPESEIVYLGKNWHSCFIPGRIPAIDRVVEVPPYPGVGAPAYTSSDTSQLGAFFCEMQSETFDLAIQLHGGGRYSNPFTKRLGARLTVGLQDYDAPPLDISIPYIYFQHEVLRYLEVVLKVGAKTSEIQPEVLVGKQDMAEAVGKIKNVNKRFAVLHPGASDRRRQWPPEFFGNLAIKLYEHGLDVYVTGIASESYLAEVVAAKSRGIAINLAGSLSLGGLAGLLSQAEVVVSNDTGPLHLADAVGAKTVGIYWCSNLITASILNRTRHRPHSSWILLCPVCGANYGQAKFMYRRVCGHEVSFVSDVTVSQVYESVLSLL